MDFVPLVEPAPSLIPENVAAWMEGKPPAKPLCARKPASSTAAATEQGTDADLLAGIHRNFHPEGNDPAPEPAAAAPPAAAPPAEPKAEAPAVLPLEGPAVPVLEGEEKVKDLLVRIAVLPTMKSEVKDEADPAKEMFGTRKLPTELVMQVIQQK